MVAPGCAVLGRRRRPPRAAGVRRPALRLAPDPEVVRIHGECMALPAFAGQAPGK